MTMMYTRNIFIKCIHITKKQSNHGRNFVTNTATENKKSFKVTINADVERIVANDGFARRLSVALKMFKDVVMKLSGKKILILADWLVKWCLYLQNELNFTPKNLKLYKQREIILVDFGFNIGSDWA